MFLTHEGVGATACKWLNNILIFLYNPEQYVRMFAAISQFFSSPEKKDLIFIFFRDNEYPTHHTEELKLISGL